MGTEKRQRQKEGRQARIAAAEAAQRHSQRRRKYVSFLVMAVAVLALFALVNHFTDARRAPRSPHSGSTTTTVAGTSTTAALASAKGKDCVAAKGPLPKGAPSRAGAGRPAAHLAGGQGPQGGHRRRRGRHRLGDGQLHRRGLLHRQDLRLVLVAGPDRHLRPRPGHQGLDPGPDRHEGGRRAPAGHPRPTWPTARPARRPPSPPTRPSGSWSTWSAPPRPRPPPRPAGPPPTTAPRHYHRSRRRADSDRR